MPLSCSMEISLLAFTSWLAHTQTEGKTNERRTDLADFGKPPEFSLLHSPPRPSPRPSPPPLSLSPPPPPSPDPSPLSSLFGMMDGFVPPSREDGEGTELPLLEDLEGQLRWLHHRSFKNTFNIAALAHPLDPTLRNIIACRLVELFSHRALDDHLLVSLLLNIDRVAAHANEDVSAKDWGIRVYALMLITLKAGTWQESCSQSRDCDIKDFIIQQSGAVGELLWPIIRRCELDCLELLKWNAMVPTSLDALEVLAAIMVTAEINGQRSWTGLKKPKLVPKTRADSCIECHFLYIALYILELAAVHPIDGLDSLAIPVFSQAIAAVALAMICLEAPNGYWDVLRRSVPLLSAEEQRELQQIIEGFWLIWSSPPPDSPVRVKWIADMACAEFEVWEAPPAWSKCVKLWRGLVLQFQRGSIAEASADNERAKIDIQTVVEVDNWQFPVWIEDADTLQDDPVELGRRYARHQLAITTGQISEQDFMPVSAQRLIDAALQNTRYNKSAVEMGMEAEILSILRGIPDSDWKCSSRAYVTDEKVTQQFTLGLLASCNQFANIPLPTKATFRYPGFCALLLRYIKSRCSEAEKLSINCIQVTKNLLTKPHKDKNNRGDSIGVTFGNFTGGELWVEQKGGKYKQKIGCETVQGIRHDTCARPIVFNANKWHCTCPFSGERYAIVYFCMGRGNDNVPALSRAFLENLGFSMPLDASYIGLTDTELQVLPLFDTRAMIKDEPGRVTPPRPKKQKLAKDVEDGEKLPQKVKREPEQ
eukprot:gnl/MRDRNA2_/MRDRNA2_57801_c0_seq1.p1 gnl/MRDRNA2_/MRDRNA2_57801_c0~~gnl/MRDRNA2_/MRDRNA2_57801_c0_seq1.p1  ORF type:complete len:765 (-),score=93.12 gnl/MRDRNA2_/MRDRNA2_57801_c0_seq1:71-2365(-)